MGEIFEFAYIGVAASDDPEGSGIKLKESLATTSAMLWLCRLPHSPFLTLLVKPLDEWVHGKARPVKIAYVVYERIPRAFARLALWFGSRRVPSRVFPTQATARDWLLAN